MAKTDAPVLAALSSLWRKIREKDSRAPDVVIDLQPGRPSSCGTVEWDTAPVLVMNLKQGDEKLTGAQILEWMLHMAAHAASFGDTGAEGRYHSQAFAEAARGLGLSVSSTRIPGIGWSPQGLARGTRTRYATEVRAIDRVMRHWTPDVLRAGYRGASEDGVRVRTSPDAPNEQGRRRPRAGDVFHMWPEVLDGPFPAEIGPPFRLTAPRLGRDRVSPRITP